MNQYLPPPIPPAKKRRRWPWVVLATFALFVFIGVVANNNGPVENGATGVTAGNEVAGQGSQVAPANENNMVVYRVTGTGIAGNITYTTDGMSTTNSEDNVQLPWEKTIALPNNEVLQVVQVMAQGTGEGSVIDATITVNGELVKQAHSEGYGIASAVAEIGTLG